jgi:ATP/maltotriose-dependent transcriptional regulator MalT
MSRFSYAEALAQFERALPNAGPEAQARLSGKIGLALFYGARPDLATPWFQRSVELCTSHAELRAQLPAALQLIPRERWLESRTTDALAVSKEARTIALQLNDVVGVRRAEVSIASWLVLLGDYRNAKRYVRNRGDALAAEIPAMRADRLAQRAIIYATQGRASAAFAEFERALDVAKELLDGYLTTVIWDDYANWATALGRLDVARSCRERALFVARERRVAWRIPYLTLRLANMLVVTGDYDHAHDLLLDAMTYVTETPVLQVLVATTGTEVAMARNDDALLKRVMRDEALEHAFRSREPANIAAVTSAFAKALIMKGNSGRAKSLIARAIAESNQADHAGDLLALAGRHGSQSDSSRARSLLVERTKLPNSDVAKAYLGLWEAYTTQRYRGNPARSAARAAKLFSRLGYHHQATAALRITGGASDDHRTAKSSALPLASHLSPALTAREQQVAELVLRGLTNRAIGQTLEISEHTVETHVTSILNRLGLRSRWQLVDLTR